MTARARPAAGWTARALAGGLMAALLGAGAAVAAAGELPPPARPLVMDLIGRPMESQEKAFNERLKTYAQAASPGEPSEARPRLDRPFPPATRCTRR